MFAYRIILLLVTSVLTISGADANTKIPLESHLESGLVLQVSSLLCQASIKELIVYFENETSRHQTREILQQVTQCGMSYISLRNRNRSGPLEAIKDDGVLMYMLMIQNDILQPLALSLFRKKSAAKHLSHVFLLIRNSENVSDAWLRSTFKQFWQIWLLNIVIIYWRAERLQIYRYNPFNDNYLIEVRYGAELPKLRTLFPTVIPNMQRKPLRMCIYSDEVRSIYGSRGQIYGTDGLMSEYIAERLNATRMVSRVQLDGQHNLSADICFMEIAKEYDDVAMNIRFLSPESFGKHVEFTVAHNRDDLCVIVPKADTAPTFWNMFRSFGCLVWLSLLASLLLANIFCYWTHHGHGIGVGLHIFGCMLGHALPLSSVPCRSSMRLFLVFWLYFSMLICTAFKGNLTSMLVSHKNLPDINDLPTLAQSEYRLLTRPRHLKHIERFLLRDHQLEGRVRQLMLPVPDMVLLRTLRRNDLSYAYLEKYHIAKFRVQERRHTERGRPLFHLMENCLVPFHAVYIVPYGSPYLGYLNRLIRSAHEFGFERYWDRIMNSIFLNAGAKVVHRRRRQNTDDSPVVLKIEHLHAVFCLWAVGEALALLVFLWERLKRN